MATSRVPWAIIVPVKRLAVAKSRLLVAPELRAELALAMALDSVAAALACPVVTTVVAVNDDADVGARLRALGATVVRDEPDAGLNSALEHGAAAARVVAGGSAVAALSADLPALRPAELAVILDAAAPDADAGRAVVADAAGTGTTLLTAGPGAALRPAFGGDSRAAHVASGARDLTAVAGQSLRRDVDTVADLRAAHALGCGPATTEVLARHPELLADGRPMPPDPHATAPI
jgi:2-phospho-L-lactate guanylyltransferase